MNWRIHRALVIVLACAVVLVVPGAVLTVLWADLGAPQRELVAAHLIERAGVIVLVLAAGLVGAGMLVAWTYRIWVGALHKASEKIQIMLSVNRALRLSDEGHAQMSALAASINTLADQRDALQADIDRQVAEAKAGVEAERNRLAALMSELAQSVVVCNLGGNVLLYNQRARAQLEHAAGGEGQLGTATLGLGRSIFGFIERDLIGHALDQLRQRLDRGEKRPVTHLVTSTRAGLLMRVQVAPVLGQGDGSTAPSIDGYVLLLENVTKGLEIEGQRDQLISALTEGSRASLGNIRAAVENLVDYPDIAAAQREHFLRIIHDEVASLGERINQAHTGLGDALRTRWPLEEMLGVDLIQAAARRIEERTGLPVKLEELDEHAWVKVDSFTVVQALHYLAQRLRDEYEVREVRFALRRSGRLVEIDLIWSGVVMGSETLTLWETDLMSTAGAFPPLSLREVVARHDAEMWFQRNKATHRTSFRLVLASAVPAGSSGAEVLPAIEARPAYYDFDLFRHREVSQELENRSLEELAYTAFDTETTGLEPSAGDEIIQIGAVRILNNKLLRDEIFDQLIDPKRGMKAESIAIHGITPDMLRGQPDIGKVLPGFHAFCSDTVLVAHNAAFDLRFLELKEEATGIRFRQPLLDTLLLSAVVHPGQDLHRLETIAERLGVNVVGRHTALGDAMVTGEVLLRLIPLLKAQGIVTLAQALAASQKTQFAQLQY
ncbi:DNA polymerase III PolC-type [Burkholderiales bacterium]|nr:DNA polymerase III PolC-type [Burkholderiales bacterium]